VKLELQGVEKVYPGAQGVPVLRDVAFRLDRGESVAVVGPSGCGKSTLLNILGLLDPPTGGVVTVFGRDAAELSPRERAALRASRIGFVFQLHHLLPQCTGLENVLLPIAADRSAGRGARRAIRRRRETRIRELAAQVGLADRLHAPPAELSGGERQRVAILRALVNEPAVVLADEPTGNLDGETERQVADLLYDLSRRDGVGLVVVTHSSEVAARADRVLHLREGRLA